MPQLDTFLDFNFDLYKLPIITVYKQPSDFPDYFVARLFDVDIHTSNYILRRDLSAIRAEIPIRFYKMEAVPSDDPVIQEVWL